MTAAELATPAQAAEKTKTARQQAAQEKREQLKSISAELQAQRDLMQAMGMEDLPTINEMLHDYYAKKNNITELNTFDQWKDKGYQVRKGEKAFLFWGKPRSNPPRSRPSRNSRPSKTTQRKTSISPSATFSILVSATKHNHRPRGQRHSRPPKGHTTRQQTHNILNNYDNESNF